MKRDIKLIIISFLIGVVVTLFFTLDCINMDISSYDIGILNIEQEIK
jgi:hypothetical protein